MGTDCTNLHLLKYVLAKKVGIKAQLHVLTIERPLPRK